MFTPEEMLSALTDLPIKDQVDVLEQLMNSSPIEEVVDVAVMGLMTVRLGVDASWPADLVARVETMSDKIAAINKTRFGDSPTDE
ncbi:hypothetical protein AACH06_25475 [Ideonella sp. DXS29W]|uniref:Uncharacterized protein n=1 Tax=Ideonella lacteola TaxID=2984193 RepID=A0ABU9BWE4_9BURK